VVEASEADEVPCAFEVAGAHEAPDAGETPGADKTTAMSEHCTIVEGDCDSEHGEKTGEENDHVKVRGE
jgi:hypothetical protein